MRRHKDQIHAWRQREQAVELQMKQLQDRIQLLELQASRASLFDVQPTLPRADAAEDDVPGQPRLLNRHSSAPLPRRRGQGKAKAQRVVPSAASHSAKHGAQRSALFDSFIAGHNQPGSGARESDAMSVSSIGYRIRFVFQF